MQFTIDITETLSRGITVNAMSEEEALDIVKRGYKNEEYVLDYNDLCSTDFSVNKEHR